MARLRLAATLLAAMTGAAVQARADSTLTIATVNNGDMVVMQRLSTAFTAQHPDIHLKWMVLDENTLRQRVTQDVATKAGSFDLFTIGNYEVPIWAKQGWLLPFDDLPASYDEGDLLRTVRDGDSYQGKLYALPFYAESAVTYYRTDLFKKAGISMPDAPTYEQVRQFADKVTDKSGGHLRHVPARQAGLGREHGVRDLAGDRDGRAVVRRGVASGARHQAVA